MDDKELGYLARELESLATHPNDQIPFRLYNLVAKLDLAKAELLKRADQKAREQNTMI